MPVWSRLLDAIDRHGTVAMVTLAAARGSSPREAGARMIGRNDFLDPSGNHWQVVDYRDIQFTKAPRILQGMGLEGLDKSERALGELRAKGLAD